MNRPTNGDAHDTLENLERAQHLAATAHARGWRWIRIYLTGWAAGGVVLVLLIGLAGTTGMIVGMAGWAVLVGVGVTWSRRQGFVVNATGRRLGVAAGLWGAAYGLVLAVGLPAASGDPAFWIPAAAFTTVPLLLAAYLPERRSEDQIAESAQ